ncbi:MAG: type I-E CRISPR-associated protein Cas7/Cse4/CasC [Armatimonadetes bacterium]|nr:type I-E CRISPR-associated protein Cas7/Cse4/CasC [Armatimonadota bacterium]
MYVELHMLQSFGPSCLNRDDVNAPKDCLFGGVRRARISSQCIKRAVRWHPAFSKAVGQEISKRTKRQAERLTKELCEETGADEDLTGRIVSAVFSRALVRVEKNLSTNVLLFLGKDEVSRIRQAIVDNWDALAKAAAKGKEQLAKVAKKVAEGLKPGTKAADVALFGRMVADKPTWNVDAACQVAHAISTHRVQMESDFYTAVDDLNPQAETGAGMMGTIEFNSACFYRYSLLDWCQLLNNFAGKNDGGKYNNPTEEDYRLARAAVEGFLRASVFAIPSGRQHSMAAQNLPSFVMVVVRPEGAPCSLANAFEQPVRVSEYETGGLVRKSIEALDDYWARLDKMYGTAKDATVIACWDTEAEVKALAPARVESVEKLFQGVIGLLPSGGGD